MKNFCLPICFILGMLPVFSQNQIDSLKQQLKAKISTKERIDIYNNLINLYTGAKDSLQAKEYFNKAISLAEKNKYDKGLSTAYNLYAVSQAQWGKYPKALKLFRKALKIAQEDDYVKGELQAYTGLGVVNDYQGNNKEALIYYKKALKIAQENKLSEEMAKSYNNVAIIYFKQEQFPKSLLYHEKALKIGEKLQDDNIITMAYTNIAIIHSKSKNYKKALAYYQKALKISKKNKDKFRLFDIYINIGELHKNREEYEKALKYFEDALKLTKQTFGKQGASYIYGNIGIVYFEQGKYQEALVYNKKALEIFEEIGDKYGIANANFEIARNHYKLKKYDKAKEVLGRSLKLASETEHTEVVRKVRQYLAKVYEAMGDYQKAYENYVIFKQMSDKFLDIEQAKILAQIESNYIYSKKEDSLKVVQANKDKIHEAELTKRKSQQTLSLVALVFMLILIGVLYVFYRSIKKNNRKLENTLKENQAYTKRIEEQKEEIEKSDEKLRANQNVLRKSHGKLTDALKKNEKAKAQIIKINDRINESVAYASNIQKSILVDLEKIARCFPESFVYFSPLDVVSGDFYFFAQVEYKAVISAVDCTGHGIPGAFMSLIGNNLLNEIVNVKKITEPDKILNMLRADIIKVLKQDTTNNQDGMDIAICTVDTYSKELYEEKGLPHLEYAGAGNPLIYFQNNELHRIKGDKLIIGGFWNYVPDKTFALHRIPLDTPTTFYIFSDGIQDQFGGEAKKKFTPRRLRNLLQEIHQKPMETQKGILSQTVTNWKKDGNEEQIDDMLLIGVKV